MFANVAQAYMASLQQNQAGATAPAPAGEEETPFAVSATVTETNDQGQEIDPTEEGSMLSAVAGDLATGVVETPEAVASGAVKAVNEVSDTTHSLAQWLNQHVLDLGYINLDLDPDTPLWENSEAYEARLRSMGVNIHDPDETNVLRLPQVGDGQLDSNTAKFVQGATQFVVGMVGAGRVLKGVGAEINGVKGAMVKGAMSDAFAFDPHEQRLSNFVQHYPSLQNPVTEFLAAKPEDTEAVGRFKNALEGLGLGIAVEGIFQGVRAIRASRHGNQDELIEATEAAEAALKEEGIDVDSALLTDDNLPRQMELDLTGGGPKADSAHEVLPPTDAAKADKIGEVVPDKRLLADVKVEPPIKIREEKLVEFREALEKDTNGFTTSGTLGKEGFDFNFDRIDSDDSLKNTLNHISTFFEEGITKFKGGNAEGVRSHAAVKRNAARFMDEIGGNTDLYFQRMGVQARNLKHLDSEILAQRTLMVSITEEINKVSKALVDDLPYKGKSGVELEDYLEKMETLGIETVAMVKGQQTNIARALNAMKIQARSREDLTERLSLSDRNMTAKQRAARHLAAGSNQKSRAKALQAMHKSKFWGVHNEYWISMGLLSSPKTHIINVASNALQVGYIPIERMVAGAFAKDVDMMKEGFYQFMAVHRQLTDATRAAFKVMRSRDADNILDVKHTVMDPGVGKHAITSKYLGFDKDSKIAPLIDGLGQVIRLSSRALATEDEFFKQLAFRSRVAGIATREGRSKGLGGVELELYVRDRLDSAFEPTGAFKEDNALAQAGIIDARKATFTQDLEGGIGKNLQEIKGQHPWFNIIMPFVRTPTNLMRWTWQRTPLLNQLQFQHKADLEAGGVRAAEAHARTALGGAFIASAATMAATGLITGHGPSNRFEREALMATGWKPYSYRYVDDDGNVNYISYQRMDPFGTIFGVVADWTEVAGRANEREAEESGMALAAAVARNLTSKSYLTGLTSALEALTDGEKFMESYIRNQAASYVPAFLKTFDDDPYLREARTVLEAVRRKAGMGENLDPKRNLLGEVVHVPTAIGPDKLSPFATGLDVNDPLPHALADLEYGFMPPAPTKGNVDLLSNDLRTAEDQTAYDRWQELTGTIKIGNRTLRERLTELVQSERYQRMSDSIDLPGATFQGTKLTAVQEIVGRYRDRAFRELRKENKLVDEAIRQDERNARLARRHGVDAIINP